MVDYPEQYSLRPVTRFGTASANGLGYPLGRLHRKRPPQAGYGYNSVGSAPRIDFIDDSVVVERTNQCLIEAQKQAHQILIGLPLQGDTGVLTVVRDDGATDRRHCAQSDLAAGVDHEPLQGGKQRGARAAGRSRGAALGHQAATAIGSVRCGATFQGNNSAIRFTG